MRFFKFKNEKYSKMAEIPHQFKAETVGDSSKITIYGVIGSSWWDDSTSASDIERVLKDINSDTIHVHINSGGGDAFDGIAIYNQLKNHAAKIIIHIDGLAASAASIIAMAADELIMNTGSMLMIHEGSTFDWGTKTQFRKTLNALEGLDKSIADVYMTRFKGEREEIDTMIVNETWFTADEAVEVGLADKVNKVNEEDPDEEQELSAEEFKNSVLARFKQKKDDTNPMVADANKSILERFKRPV